MLNKSLNLGLHYLFYTFKFFFFVMQLHLRDIVNISGFFVTKEFGK